MDTLTQKTPWKWSREQAIAAGVKGRATRARNIALRESGEALERLVSSGDPIDLDNAIKMLTRQLPRSMGTIRGTRLTEQIRNLVHAQRLMKSLPRGHTQEPESAKPLPNPIE